MTTIGQRDLVRAQLAEAKARGVEFRTGRVEPVGNHFAPVLLVDPPEDLALCREESFGPILPVFTVDSEDEAVKRANDTPYGLTASVWSRDLARAEGVGRRLVAGVVTVNNHAFTGGVAAAPWGGTRGSGYGVTNSPRVLDEVTRPRFVLVDASRGKREPWWQPYDASALQLGRGMARLRSGRLSALPDVVKGFLKRGG
jgi:acyl-CoA reductase-like NAD-dependent aldehyde dehydrogenase